MLTTKTRKTKYGFRGYVVCQHDNGKVIWSEKAGPVRICREDAQEDADRLKSDRLATWYPPNEDKLVY